MRTRLLLVFVLSLFALLVTASTGGTAPTQANPELEQSKGFRKAVTVAGIREHQAALQSIANANNGTRVSGTPGYTASVAYVVAKLQAAGYSPTVQTFDFDFFRELAPAQLSQVSPTPTTYSTGTFTYSGSGDVTATVQGVDLVLPPAPVPSSTSGCEDSDFAGFVAGNIALIQRGSCTFHDKALNAQNHGASAVVIFNEGQPGRTDLIVGTLGTAEFSIPVVGLSFADGAALAATPAAVLHVKTETLSEVRQTANVVAETPGGDPNKVVVVGAHLDSVAAGPGINDNGSGSATILEIAEVHAAQGRTPRNKIRFAWWGAEEFNLLGSAHYVGNLSNAQKDAIALNLNFDMVGSPNFVRFVYDGDGSDTPNAGPPGSDEIEKVFTDYFAAFNLANEATAFDGRSDYGPFIGTTSPGHPDGIPAGGLFTGAEGIKTAAQVATYGGTAGQQYDPCYHQACDTFSNNSNTALDQVSDAAAHTVLTFSRRMTLFP